MSYVIMLWLQKWRFHHHFFLELVVRNYIMYENVWKKIKIGKKVTWKINLVLKDAFFLFLPDSYRLQRLAFQDWKTLRSPSRRPCYAKEMDVKKRQTWSGTEI